MPLIPEVLDLQLSESGGPWLAVAVVRIGPVELRNVRVRERNGRRYVALPAYQGRDAALHPAVRLDEPVFLALKDAVLTEFRRAVEADPWSDVRTAFPSASVR